ncbi:MAG: hypothetical protein ACE5G5_00670 [Candidatus Methylomirabilales bacterium]
MKVEKGRYLSLVMFFLALPAAGKPTLSLPEAFQGETGKSVREVVEDPTLHREMGGLRLRCEQPVFEYLLEHPDFAASLARAAGVLRYTVERRGEAEYWANDHDGLTGRLTIVQPEAGRAVLFAEGTYKKGIFRIPGRVAIAMRFSEERDNNVPYVDNTLAGYIRLDAALLDPLARLFRPIVASIMDKRVHWFFRKINRLMARLHEDPESLLQELPPDAWQKEADELRSLLAPSLHDPDPADSNSVG